MQCFDVLCRLLWMIIFIVFSIFLIFLIGGSQFFIRIPKNENGLLRFGGFPVIVFIFVYLSSSYLSLVILRSCSSMLVTLFMSFL